MNNASVDRVTTSFSTIPSGGIMRGIRFFAKRSIVASAVLLTSTGLRAQDGAAMDMTGMGLYAMEDSVMASAQSTVTRSHHATPRATPRVSIGRMAYAPSIERRRRNFAQFVARTRAKDPAGAARMQALFASTDIIAAMGRALAPFGLRTDNVADAYAAWWINAWLASRGRSDNPTRGQIDAVKAQATQALGSTPQLANANDTLKQEVAEAHLIQAALIESYMTKSQGNAAQRRAIANAVRQGARRSGLDLDSMELTPSGFVPRRAG